jgi:hypothetical protein
MAWEFELELYDPADRGSFWAVRVLKTDQVGRVIEECTVRFVGNDAELRAREYLAWLIFRKIYRDAGPTKHLISSVMATISDRTAPATDSPGSWRDRKPLL